MEFERLIEIVKDEPAFETGLLLAGKIHAILQHSLAKGRDLYDLLWYLSDPEWTDPNLSLLNNALLRTGWESPALTERNWRDILRQRGAELEWRRVHDDVVPFLERAEESNILTRENLLRLLE